MREAAQFREGMVVSWIFFPKKIHFQSIFLAHAVFVSDRAAFANR